jgi:hypothetical protein
LLQFWKKQEEEGPVIDPDAEGIPLDKIIERIRKIKPDLVESGGQGL